MDDSAGREVLPELVPQPEQVLRIVASWSRTCLELKANDPRCSDFHHQIDFAAAALDPQVVESRPGLPSTVGPSRPAAAAARPESTM